MPYIHSRENAGYADDISAAMQIDLLPVRVEPYRKSLQGQAMPGGILPNGPVIQRQPGPQMPQGAPAY